MLEVLGRQQAEKEAVGVVLGIQRRGDGGEDGTKSNTGEVTKIFNLQAA